MNFAATIIPVWALATSALEYLDIASLLEYPLMHTPRLNSVKINLIKTPVFPRKKSLYRLPDSTYGEWIIFENNEPKYYFDFFDELYEDIRNQIMSTRDIEGYFTKMFEQKNLNFMLKQTLFGIPLPGMELIEECTLSKLPKEYLI
ncbi:MAG: hypothetical protein ABI477_04720 [Chryseolinea sp.]